MKVFFLSAVLAWASFAVAAEQTHEMVTEEPPLGPISTHHQITIGGRKVRYAAIFAETPLTDASGVLQATLSATTYAIEQPHDRTHRPVLFLFNGGPGASSSPLHFNAFGPRRLDERHRMVDNEHSLLDVADLVFIDPVGTGFSRERPGGTSGAYWSVAEDATSVLALIRQWLADNGRAGSPVLIAGESYGGYRLATLLKDSGDLPLAGIVLVSPMLDASGSSEAPGNDQPYIFSLPSMAVAAREHNKIDRAGQTLEQVYLEAEHFAQSDYAVALQQGSLLPAAQRARIAGRMSGLIGLPVQTLEEVNLRVGIQFFLEHLLAGEGLLVGRLDSRVTAPKPDPDKAPQRPPGANDPALGLGASNVVKSEVIKTYMEQELGVHTARDYLSLTLDVNFRWHWGSDNDGPPRFYDNATPNIAAAMAKHPHMRVLLVGGYYDLAVPVLGPRYALAHAGVPMDRVDMRAFVAPHSAFQGEANLTSGSGVVREFIREVAQ